MTVTPPRRTAHDRARRRLAAALVALAAFVPATLLGLPAAALAATPTPTPTPEVPGVASLTLSPLSGGVVRPGEALAVSVTLDNETATTLSGGPVELSIGVEPIGDRRTLSAWLDGGDAAAELQPIGTGGFSAIAPGAATTTGLTVAPTATVISALPPGVYPLAASYADGAEDGALTARSVMIVPDDAVSANVAIVVPVTAAPLATGLLTATELAELTATGGALANTLDAVDGTPAILAVDPAVLASIRVLGRSAPATATAWLSRLDALPNERFALQFGDADVAAQLAAGQERPLQPTSLQYAMTPGDFTPDPAKTPGATPTPAPSSSVDPSAPVYPSLEELLAVEGARATVFWPDAGGATAPVVAALGALGADDDTAYTVLPSTRLTSGADGATVAARAAVEGAELLVTDEGISAALQTASHTDDSTLRGAALAAATAQLMLATQDAAGAPLLVTLGRGEDRSLVALGSTLLAVSQAPGVSSASLDDLLDEPGRAAILAESEADAMRADAASALFADEETLARFATVLDDARLLTAPERTAVLQLLGVGWTADPAAWAAAVEEHRAATRTTLDSVGLLTVPDVQQIGPSADIPVWVRNDLPYDVNVVLNASSDDLRLRIQGSIDVVARAQSTTRVLIPVNARIGSGEVDLSLQLRSPSLVAVGDQQVIHVTVRADWERYGVIALGVIVGGLLVVGVIRTVLRRRRSRRADESGDDVREEAP